MVGRKLNMNKLVSQKAPTDMVLEQPKLSRWDKLKRIIAFFLCPEFSNYEAKLEHMNNYASLVHQKWYRDVKAKEKGLARLNKKVGKLERRNHQLQSLLSLSNGSNGVLGKETPLKKEEAVSHNTN